MNMPWLAEAVVTAQDPDTYGLFVSLTSGFGGQGPMLPVRVGTFGPRDGVTGYFPALPTPGTPGIVAFPRSDNRNGVWLCSTTTQLTDASAHCPGSGAIDYSAHWGGGWSYRGQDGTVAEVLPDGTVLQLGPLLPVPTRHTIDGTQTRQRTAFTASQRRPDTPSPFPLSIQHPTGASGILTASGAWMISAASGQTATIAANGATVTIDARGNLIITAVASVSVVAANAVFSGNVSASGNITSNTAGSGIVILGAHLHANAGGTGNSGPPVPGT